MPVTATVSINGNALPTQLAGKLTQLTYKEGLKFTGDTVSIDIADPDGTFRRTFRLKAAIPVSVSISGGGGSRDCGTFHIHSLRYKGDKGGGSSIHIDCVSIPIQPQNSVRTERKSQGSEKTTLQDITAKIASANGLSVQFQAKNNPKIGRSDQHDQSDLVQLARHCDEENYALKIRKGAIWVLDRDQMQAQGPVGTIVIPSPGVVGGVNGIGGLLSWDINEIVEDCYNSAEVAYKDHKTGKVTREKVSDPTCADLGHVLRLKHNPHDAESTDVNAKDTSKEATQPSKPALNNPLNLIGIDNPFSAIQKSLFSMTPLQALSDTATQTLETNSDKCARAKHVAEKKLKKKNQKRHGISFEIPYNGGIESGTVYTLVNGSPDVDGPWLVVNVTHTLSKGGNKTHVQLEKSQAWGGS